MLGHTNIWLCTEAKLESQEGCSKVIMNDVHKKDLGNCQVCAGTVCRPVMRENGWQYFRCASCGLIFLSPQPSDTFLRNHYQKYLSLDRETVVAWRDMMQSVYCKNASLIESRIRPPGRLLDVGCGYGFFLSLMADRGWDVEGIEISIVARDYARTSFGLKVSSQPLPHSEWPDASFDVISLFYVIEHLKNPVSVLKEIYRLLRPGGVLLLRWPHTTPIAKIVKPWAESLRLYQAPSHLFDFSPQTIYKMTTDIGFREVSTTICGWTRPRDVHAYLASMFFGSLGEVMARLSSNRLLLPGVSKTTLAQRGRSMAKAEDP